MLGPLVQWSLWRSLCFLSKFLNISICTIKSFRNFQITIYIYNHQQKCNSTKCKAEASKLYIAEPVTPILCIRKKKQLMRADLNISPIYFLMHITNMITHVYVCLLFWNVVKALGANKVVSRPKHNLDFNSIISPLGQINPSFPERLEYLS